MLSTGSIMGQRSYTNHTRTFEQDEHRSIRDQPSRHVRTRTGNTAASRLQRDSGYLCPRTYLSAASAWLGWHHRIGHSCAGGCDAEELVCSRGGDISVLRAAIKLTALNLEEHRIVRPSRSRWVWACAGSTGTRKLLGAERHSSLGKCAAADAKERASPQERIQGTFYLYHSETDEPLCSWFVAQVTSHKRRQSFVHDTVHSILRCRVNMSPGFGQSFPMQTIGCHNRSPCLQRRRYSE